MRSLYWLVATRFVIVTDGPISRTTEQALNPASDGVMNRRDLESINGGVACRRGRRLVGKILFQGTKVAEKRVREDVLLRAVAEHGAATAEGGLLPLPRPHAT